MIVIIRKIDLDQSDNEIKLMCNKLWFVDLMC